MGCEMHCLYPNYITRFARRDAIDWPPIIHAKPVIAGRIGSIPSRRKELAMIHLAKNTVESRLEKLERYTSREVERRGPAATTPLPTSSSPSHASSTPTSSKAGSATVTPV